MKTIIITNPAQLNILMNQRACYNSISFSFSEKYIKWLKNLLNNKHSYQIILEKDGNFVGYLASAETLWNNHLTIVEAFVAPEYQGKGIGKKLLSYAIEFAKKKNLIGLIVQTESENIPAQKLYEGKGFQRFENKEWEGISYKLVF